MPKSTEVTDKDVEKSRDRVDKLRQQVASAEAELTTSEASRNNAVKQARLDAEAQRLEQRLAAARSHLKTSKQEDRLVEEAGVVEEVVDTSPSPAIAADTDEKGN